MRNPGVKFSRTDAIRSLLSRALAEEEAESQAETPAADSKSDRRKGR